MILVRLKHSLRALFAAAALVTLAGCAGGNSSADLAPAAPQQAEAPPPASQPAPQARAAPAGRNIQGAPAPPTPAPERQVAASPEQVKADCWMKYENDKKIKNIDERLKLVEKCVDETSRNQPPQRPER